MRKPYKWLSLQIPKPHSLTCDERVRTREGKHPSIAADPARLQFAEIGRKCVHERDVHLLLAQLLTGYNGATGKSSSRTSGNGRESRTEWKAVPRCR